MSQNVMGGQGNMFPLSQQEHTNFATPTQMPASAEVIRSDYDAKTQPYTGVMMANGGKTRGNKDDDNFSFDDLTKAQKEYYLDLMASPIAPPKMMGSDIGAENTLEKYMMSQAPQGFSGRIGATRVNDDGSNLRAGLSGIAMAQPGKPGITTMPGAIDVGYRSAKRSEYDPYVDLTAYRSINSMPGKGHAQGVNARYTMPFSVGGVTYDPATQTYAGTGIAQAPSAPAVTLPPLAADLVASLTPQYQAANPYKYAYDAKTQKYSAATPDMGQLQTFKAEQDRVAAEAAAAASQGYQGYAMGGDVMGYGLGGYSDGGRLLRGPGDGVSDDIPATIAGRQPARLADGEFVIPARIVSEIGNGSTDAGAKRLYAMMDRIQAGRKKTIGKKNIAKDTKAKKHLLA
jgi:hypothetical protein